MKEEEAASTSLHLSWSVIVMSVLSFLVVYRKYGGFYYRSIMSTICLLVMAIYGMCVSIVFPIFGKTHLINYSVARGYYMLGGFFCGLKVESEGEENLHKIKGPVIYVCNHQSSLDIMLMGKVYPKNTAIVAKKQLKYYPFLGWFMTLSNAIFLDRKNRDSAVKEARNAALDIHRKNVRIDDIYIYIYIYIERERERERERMRIDYEMHVDQCLDFP
ncbi:unnamed protein product [Mucor circinelloides]